MTTSVERLIERLLEAMRGKLHAKRGTVAEAQKLVIEARRHDDDSFDITLTSKTR